MSLSKLRAELKKKANPKKAKFLQRFFKTGPGEYAEGDVLLGIQVPVLRKTAKAYPDLKMSEIEKLFKSKFHEERLVGIFILIQQYKKSSDAEQKKIYNFYVKHKTRVNNWDLVDLSAPNIVGDFLYEKDRKPLYTWAKSKDLWTRRIAIISTFYFIRNHQFKDTLKISKVLLKDEHDLIHKAVGWMLREVGKKSLADEERFLKQHYRKMPRTMLRYAIEKFPESKRKAYLKGTI